jgi:hypothetical protein
MPIWPSQGIDGDAGLERTCETRFAAYLDVVTTVLAILEAA